MVTSTIVALSSSNARVSANENRQGIQHLTSRYVDEYTNACRYGFLINLLLYLMPLYRRRLMMESSVLSLLLVQGTPAASATEQVTMEQMPALKDKNYGKTRTVYVYT